MVAYKKAKSRTKITVFASVGALVASGTIGCGGQASKQQDWMVTEVATGRINLDAVKDALETSKDMTEFEKRVNEIYEGDNLVLISVEENDTQIILSGFEDLNQSNAIEEAQDEKLFAITVYEDKYEVYGYGTNHYYYYGSDYGDYDYDYDDYVDDNKALMHRLVHAQRSTDAKFMHRTSRERAAQMRRDRENFRNSSAYAGQRSANKAFFNRQKARNPQAFSSSNKNRSNQRSSYRQKQVSQIKSSRSAKSGRGMRPGS